VRVGPGLGEWPEDSANDLADESYNSTSANDCDTFEYLNAQVMLQFAKLVEPCSEQDNISKWSRISNTYEFAPDQDGGCLQGDSTLNKSYLLFLYFHVDGNRLSYEEWRRLEDQGRIPPMTSVTIKYRGPVRFVLKPEVHPTQTWPFIEHRHKAWEPSPVF
jgi:hypothetical protein